MIKQLIFIGLFLSSVNILFAQGKNEKIISTTGIIDTNATKSGFKINEYYIELTEKQLDSLKGKRVSITGKLLVIPGIDPDSKEIEQGSLNDRYFIVEPEFTIIYDTREPLIKD